jgi:hypothetical protein
VDGLNSIDANCRDQRQRQTHRTPSPESVKLSGGCTLTGYVQSRLDASSTSLGINDQNRTLCSNPSELEIKVSPWSSKQKRAYVKAKAGERLHKGETQRFTTLTSSDESVAADCDIGIDFSALKLAIGRLTPYRLYKKGYLTKGQLRYFYPGKNIHAPLVFDYFKVRTDEGNGVLHILHYGDYIPQKWLSDAWQRIHLSSNVWICTGDYLKYTINQYCSGQSGFQNSSIGGRWVFKGYMHVWDYLRRFMDVPKRVEVMDALQVFGRVDLIHKGSRYLLEVGQPLPPSPVVFIGGFSPVEGKMGGEWLDRSEVERDAYGYWQRRGS